MLLRCLAEVLGPGLALYPAEARKHKQKRRTIFMMLRPQDVNSGPGTLCESIARLRLIGKMECLGFALVFS